MRHEFAETADDVLWRSSKLGLRFDPEAEAPVDSIHGNQRRPRGGRVISRLSLSGGDIAEPYPCHRSGHDLDARIPVRRAARAGRLRAARISADLSRARLGRARSAGHLDHLGRDRARRDGERRRRREGRRGDRHHQPARDHDRLGPRDRQADPQRDRLAGPPHARGLRGARARRAREAASASAPACCSIRISRRPRSPGCSTTCRARARRRKPASSPSARSTRICCGTSPAARCTRPTPPMRRARCCSISAPANGTRSCSSCSAFRPRCCPRCATARAISAPRCRICSAAPVRILGIAGDQQAATIGQGCFKPGMMKSTYGTGCFALLNTGDTPVKSRARLLTTIAYQFEGKRTYALEGAIFIAGAAVQWLRDGLKLIATAAETGTIAAQADPADAGLHGAGLRRPRRAVVGRGGARRAVWAQPQVGSGRDQPRRARSGRLPDPRPARRDACRLAGLERSRHRAARRRRHDAERLHDAVPRRHPERAGRPARVHGDDRARRRLSGRAQGRHLPRSRRLRGDLEARPPFRAGDGRADARSQMERLAGRRAPHVDARVRANDFLIRRIARIDDRLSHIGFTPLSREPALLAATGRDRR